jgi:protein O-mannosyl-transferase
MSGKDERRRAFSKLPSLWWLLGLLLFIGIVAYWNSFDVPFVFDDLLTVQRNPAVRFGELNWHLLNPRAILYLTFTLNFILSQQNVWSYHLINLILHLANGILLFFFALHIFQRLDNDRRRCLFYALGAAAFFLLHPVQTESVTYISSRSELLSTAFYLAGVLLFVKWPERRIGFLFSLLVAIPYFFALGSKETAISLAATIFLYDFIFLSGGSFRGVLTRWRFYSTFFIGGIVAAYYIVTVGLAGSVGSSPAGHLSVLRYFLTQVRVIVRYVRLIFVPVGLNLDYDFRPSTGPLELSFILSALFLLALIGLAWVIRKRFPVFSFSIFWFFLTLAPTSSVIPILDVIFEHRLYLPLVGVSLSFPVFLEFVADQVRRRLHHRLKVGATATILLAGLMVGTILRNQVWRDETRLWVDIVAKSPNKVRAYNGLAFAYFKKGRYADAVNLLEKAIADHPEMRIELSDALGNFYFKTGQLDKAVALFSKALDTPEMWRRVIEYNNLGVAYLYKWSDLSSKKNQMPEQTFASEQHSILSAAVAAFSKCIELEPRMLAALDAMINAYSFMNETDDVEKSALARLQSKESFNDLYTVGKIAFNKNDFARAIEFFTRAEKLDPGDPTSKQFYHNFGYALNVMGQKDQAIDKYLHAIRIDPIFIEAHHNVALIYMDKHEFEKAKEHFLEVLRYDPTHVNANINLAWIYANEGNKALARNYLNTARSKAPGDERVAQVAQQFGL